MTSYRSGNLKSQNAIKYWKKLIFLASVLAGVLCAPQASKASLEMTAEEPVGVWVVTVFYFDEYPDATTVVASTNANLGSEEHIGEQLHASILCEIHDSVFVIGVDLPDKSDYAVADDTMLQVTYSVDDRSRKEARWKFRRPSSKSGNSETTPTLEVPPAQSLDFLNLLGTGDTLHLRVYLEDGRVITQTYDITGSRIIVPRVKFLCNLLEPDESPDT